MGFRVEVYRLYSAGHTEIQACGEDVRLVNACIKKHSSVKQESPVERVSLTGECQATDTRQSSIKYYFSKIFL